MKQFILMISFVATFAACKKTENETGDSGSSQKNFHVTVTLMAGSPTISESKDNADPLDARFIDPRKLVWDYRNNTLYVLDATGTSDLRKIDDNGVTTVAQNVFGVFNEGFDICLAPDSAGVLYVGVSLGQIAKINTSAPLNSDNPFEIIDWKRKDGTRKDGNETGSLDVAAVSGPYGIAAVPEKNGNIYFANEYYLTIHKVNFANAGNEVSEFAGFPTSGVTAPPYPFEDGAGSIATFGEISDMALVESTGDVLVADAGYCTVRRIKPSGEVSSYIPPSPDTYRHYIDKDGSLSEATAAWVRHVAANRDGSRIFFATSNYNLRVILPKENRVVTLADLGNTINGIATTPDGDDVYVSCGRAIYKVHLAE